MNKIKKSLFSQSIIDVDSTSIIRLMNNSGFIHNNINQRLSFLNKNKK